MTGAFVIEIFNRTAGLAISEPRGFRFYASDPLFRRIDGHKFRKLKNVHAAVAGLIELARATEFRHGSLTRFIGHQRSVIGASDGGESVWRRREQVAAGARS